MTPRDKTREQFECFRVHHGDRNALGFYCNPYVQSEWEGFEACADIKDAEIAVLKNAAPMVDNMQVEDLKEQVAQMKARVELLTYVLTELKMSDKYSIGEPECKLIESALSATEHPMPASESLLQPAVKADARKASPEQIRRGADVLASLRKQIKEAAPKEPS